MSNALLYASLAKRGQESARPAPRQGSPAAPPPPPALVEEPRPAVAGWADLLGPPAPESPRSRRMAHLGGLVAITAMLVYLSWRVLFTLPGGGTDAVAAWVLVSFEAIPLVGLLVRIVTVWNIDSWAPAPVTEVPDGMHVAVLIPTYDEPAEVLAPTIAAACALEPAHQTWVLDDGDRPWVEEICAAYGARYVRREEHLHAKAGNLNNALRLMEEEAAAGADEIDILAVLDCDHVPLPTFLTATLGWFTDPDVGLVQGPQSFHNAGAFDDDGVNGEQGLFFNVLMAARNHSEAGPFWCGSTALVRTRALREIGGVSTDTIVEDMHTTLGLLKAGWRTAYHHQTLALGLAPTTAEQYLVQRRRWGLGAMQVLTKERLWAAKHWLSWRNYYEYLSGTIWWLEGVGSVLLLMIPVTLLLAGAQTSTASPTAFTAVFGVTLLARLWGIKRLYRHQLSWTNALALRILRIPVGLSCAWWLLTRRTLEFQVTPKEGAAERSAGRVPRVLIALLAALGVVIGYAAAGLAGYVPWRSTPGATVASGAWLLVAAATVWMGMRRIRAVEYASSRRNAHRFDARCAVVVDGYRTELVDLSVGGLRVRLPACALPGSGTVLVELPGTEPIELDQVRRTAVSEADGRPVALKVRPGDWHTMRVLALWLFHTPSRAVPELPDTIPAAAFAVPDPGLWVRRSRAASARVRLAEEASGRPARLRPQANARRRPRRVELPERSARLSHVYLAVTGAIVLLSERLGARPLKDAVYSLVGLSVVIAILVGVRRYQPQVRSAWYLMATGQLLWVLADTTFNWQQDVQHVTAFPTYSDAFYLLGYPVFAVGIVRLTKARRRARTDLGPLVDCVTVVVGLGVLSWVLLTRPTIQDLHDSVAAAAVGAAYPAMDILLVGALIRLISSPGGRSTAFRFVFTALVLLISADTLSLSFDLFATNTVNTLEYLWLLSYAFWGAAALHPSMAKLSDPAINPDIRFGGIRLLAAGLATMICPAILTLHQVAGTTLDMWAVIVGSVVMSLLVVIRMSLAIQQIAAAHDALETLQHELAIEATRDSLTGLYNRTQSMRLVAGALGRSRRTGSTVGLLFIDLDGFKQINDEYGHATGDEVLRQVSARMDSVTREGDFLGRLGGDEFLIGIENVIDERAASTFAARLIAAASEPIQVRDNLVVRVGASIGITLGRGGTTDVETMVHEADLAAYQAKAGGRGRSEMFGGTARAELKKRNEIERALAHAIAHDELVMHYQPIFDVQSGEIDSYEALVRWERPGEGLVCPAEFLPVAEASDLICHVDVWVLHEVVAQLADWNRQRGDRDLRVAVNLSARHVSQHRVQRDVVDALRMGSVDPHQLIVEVTETALMDGSLAAANLEELRALGITISIDDFGTGYQSSAQLSRLPLDVLKVDGQFVDTSTARARSLLELMVKAAHAFGLTVVAEGIEHQDQLDLIRELGCEYGQGFYLGRPVAADQVPGVGSASLRAG